MEKPFNKDDEYRLLHERETLFARHHAADTDEQLLEYVRGIAQQLGRAPKKAEVVGFSYIKNRFGPWPRMLEKAGLKEQRESAQKPNSVL